MSNYLKITFSRGGALCIKLLEDKAPNNISLLKAVLPLRAKVKHTRVNGCCMYVDLPFDENACVKENVVTEKEYGYVTVSYPSDVYSKVSLQIYSDAGVKKYKAEESLIGLLEEGYSLKLAESIARGIMEEGPEIVAVEMLEK